MKKLLFSLLLLPCATFAQSSKLTGVESVPGPQPGHPQIFTYVEQMPQPGFDLNTYLAKHISYPADANKANIQGKVILHFTVTGTGSIVDIKVFRSLYPSLDSEAVHIFKAMPPWKPGKQNGHTVDVVYTCPVTFTLPDNK